MHNPLLIYCYNATAPRGLLLTDLVLHQGLVGTNTVVELVKQNPGRHVIVVFDDILSLLDSIDAREKHQLITLFSELSRHLDIRWVKPFFIIL